ncbi:unnamed protein product [Brassica oleracea var. botrytis]
MLRCKVSGETIEVATFDLATNDEERLLQEPTQGTDLSSVYTSM